MFKLRCPLLQEAAGSTLKIVSSSLQTRQITFKRPISSGHHLNQKNVTSAQKQCYKHTHGSFYCSSSMATPAVGTINEMKLPCTAMILDRMFSSSWLAAKNIMNIRARCFCSKSDTTEVHSASAQGIDMNLAKPKRKEAADPLEIPEPARPEDPLPGIPVPGFPDVTIPFAPDLPIPDLPEVPVPVKPGELPNKTLPGKPSPIFDNILPKSRAPVLPDLSTLFTSPIVLHKAVENYKSEYLMLSSQIEIISKANNYFFKKCGLPASSIIQPIDQKIILKLNENDAFSNNENVNKLILAILELSPVQIAALLSLLQNLIWLLSNMKKIPHCNLNFGMSDEELDKIIQLAAILQREVLQPMRMETLSIRQSELLHPKYTEC
ncbi:hypothetical protein HF086_001005 [Spodoptera exigua]|uniref:Uncharacterized protein n=1 Tax=Spodoptera exigua TaxID=7107 RepID=A0A922M5I0_SPOEX|nr:hypothetical protein HF086_001005 [Spodoptera exigua]